MSQVKYLITVDGVSTEYSHQMFARGYLLKIVDEYPEGTIVKVETVPPSQRRHRTHHLLASGWPHFLRAVADRRTVPQRRVS